MIDANAPVTALYAKWTANTYSVSYDLNSGHWDGAAGADSYTYGTGLTLPSNLTRTGYTFAGWCDNAQLTGSPITKISSTEAESKNFYAKWTLDAPTVSPRTRLPKHTTQQPLRLPQARATRADLPILRINGIRTGRKYPVRQTLP